MVDNVMIGKARIFMPFFTTVSFIMIHVYHAQSKCIDRDLKAHLYDELLNDHWFEIKVFSDTNLTEKEEKLLSVINTLCTTWNTNKNKLKEFEVVKTFELMLKTLFSDNETYEDKCMNYNCTEGFELRYVSVKDFGSLYSQSCNGSVSDLKCPSKQRTTSSTPEISQNTTAHKWKTPSTPEISQNTTAHEWTTSSTPEISQNTTAHKSTDTLKFEQNEQTTMWIQIWAAASSLVNILILILGMWYFCKNKKCQTRNSDIELESVSKC